MRHLLAVPILASLCACNALTPEIQHYYAYSQGWNTPTAFTTADARMITQRQHPVMKNEVICTEPSPDVAKALSTAVGLTAQGGNGAASGSLGASGASAEAVAELAGRSTALLGLRDGLYRACEAYANGVIGQDAYALVLSRYAQLMTTLFLGQDITGAAGAEGKAAATSAALQALGGQQSSNGGNNSNQKPSSTGNSTGQSSDASGSTDALPPVMFAAASGSDLAMKPLLIGNPPAAPNPPPPPAKDATPPTTNNSGNQSPSTNGGQAQPATAGTVSTAAALALTRMNEDFLHEGIIGPIMIACINEGDPTRYRPVKAEKAGYQGGPESAMNDWLWPICQQIGLAALQQMEQNREKTPYPPVNPEVAAVQPSSGQGNKPPGGNGAAAPNAQVKAVQNALHNQAASCAGSDPGAIDGVNGSNTINALRNPLILTAILLPAWLGW